MTTKTGETLPGFITKDEATSDTLRMAGGVEQAFRSQIADKLLAKSKPFVGDEPSELGKTLVVSGARGQRPMLCRRIFDPQ